MSTSLSWRKIMPSKYLGYRLKFYLAEMLWDYDGSLHVDWTRVSKDNIDVSYLRGVMDETDDKVLKGEIKTFLDLLDKYGEIEIEKS